MRSLFSGFILLCLLSVSTLNAGFVDRKAEGWHYYETLEHPEEPKEDQKEDQSPVAPPEERLASFKKEVERLKAVAVMEPTYNNVKAYMTIQKEMMDKASAFSSRWMEVVFTTPQLDHNIKSPTSQAGRHVFLAEKRHQMDQEIARLSETYGLFFFYSGSCAYCKKFAPIVKAFSERYGWDVMAISMDGSTLPEFPDAVVDNGIAARFQIEDVPLLMAVNPETGKTDVLSHGFSSQQQIIDRIRVLILERRPS